MKQMIIRYIVLVMALGMFAGCASMHIGDTTHTHIYEDLSSVDTSDPVLSAFMKALSFAQGMVAEDAAPLKGFVWDDDFITRLEKEQKNKAKNKAKDKGTDDEFNEHF